jgi:hypothetical protein
MIRRVLPASLFIVGIIILCCFGVPAYWKDEADYVHVLHSNIFSGREISVSRFVLYIAIWGSICFGVNVILNNKKKLTN